ncbi:MAG: hypothetical protein U0228_35155 [Myxococcaceae bacterium]
MALLDNRLRLLLGTLAALLPGCGPRVDPPPPPFCFDLPATIDFGVLEGSASRSFRFDPGGRSVKLELETASPFTVVPSGKVQTVPFEFFDLTVVAANLGGLEHRGQLTLTAQDCPVVTAELRATGAGSLEAIPPRFTHLPVGVAVTLPMTIRNTRRIAQDVSITAVDTPAGVTISFSPSRLTLEPSSAALVDVTLTVAAARPSGTIKVEVASTREFVLPEIVFVPGTPNARLVEPALDIAILPSAGFVERDVHIENRGDDLLVERSEVVAMQGSPTELAVTTVAESPFVGPTVLPGNATTAVRLSIDARPPLGPRAWLVRLFTNQDDRPVLELPVTGTVQEVTPCEPRVLPMPGALTFNGSATIAFPSATEGCLLDDLRLQNCPAGWAVTPNQLLTTVGANPVSATVSATGPGQCFLNVRLWPSTTQLFIPLTSF